MLDRRVQAQHEICRDARVQAPQTLTLHLRENIGRRRRRGSVSRSSALTSQRHRRALGKTTRPQKLGKRQEGSTYQFEGVRKNAVATNTCHLAGVADLERHGSEQIEDGGQIPQHQVGPHPDHAASFRVHALEHGEDVKKGHAPHNVLHQLQLSRTQCPCQQRPAAQARQEGGSQSRHWAAPGCRGRSREGPGGATGARSRHRRPRTAHQPRPSRGSGAS